MLQRREIEICIVSDVHLGSKGCNALAFNQYLSSIKTDLLIMNGDIIDIWAFSKSNFNNLHGQVIWQILKMVEEGTRVIYVTGNHDEALRKYSGQTLGGISLQDHYNFNVDGDKYWVFHGDVFDRTTKGYAKMLAKLGGFGYDMLIRFNRLVNNFLLFFGGRRLSFSGKIKKSVKRAAKWISDFEAIATELAIDQKYDFVVCGHIHEPKIQKVKARGGKGSVVYMNSGDWIENLTSLEYLDGRWRIHKHQEGIEQDIRYNDFSIKHKKDAELMEIIEKFKDDRKKIALNMLFNSDEI